MNLFQNIVHNKLYKNIQGKSNKNRAVFLAMKELDFPMPNIRKALFCLNGINIRKLANGKVSSPTIYSTINGIRKNADACEESANALGLRVEEIYPPAE